MKYFEVYYSRSFSNYLYFARDAKFRLSSNPLHSTEIIFEIKKLKKNEMKEKYENIRKNQSDFEGTRMANAK